MCGLSPYLVFKGDPQQLMTMATDVVKVPGAAENGGEQTNTNVTKSCPGFTAFVCVTNTASSSLCVVAAFCQLVLCHFRVCLLRKKISQSNQCLQFFILIIFLSRESMIKCPDLCISQYETWLLKELLYYLENIFENTKGLTSSNSHRDNTFFCGTHFSCVCTRSTKVSEQME